MVESCSKMCHMCERGVDETVEDVVLGCEKYKRTKIMVKFLKYNRLILADEKNFCEISVF